MILTLKIKLLPTKEQTEILLKTLEECNSVCNSISKTAWENKVFNQFKLHGIVYHNLKSTTNLSAQSLVRCISKVADAYKVSKTLCKFKPYGSITYDNRILSYKETTVSIWAVGGRLKIPFICHNPSYLPYVKGEADLVYKKGKFYLFQCVDIPEDSIEDIEEFIGVDFGLNSIISTSTGLDYSSSWINNYRDKQSKIRSSIQNKGTRNSRKLLKRLSGRERTTATIINHTISKHLVDQAKQLKKDISIENIHNIRNTSKRRNKRFRTKLNRWSFHQLRSFIEYKCKLNGVKLVAVNPAYTSQTCSSCKHIGKRNNKIFQCNNQNCGVDIIDADLNAANNISLLGAAVNQPERCSEYTCRI